MTPKQFKRFETRYVVDPNCGCWLWIGSVTHGGYGQMYTGGPRVNLRAHRLSYEHFVGPIPDGLLVCHRCDVPACVNPQHLFVGTPKQNTDDMMAKGRQSSGVRPSGDAHWCHRNAHLMPRGEQNKISKFTVERVRELRDLRKQGMSLRALAKRFGVSKPAVHNILLGKTWRHVA